jgi:copper chaperone
MRLNVEGMTCAHCERAVQQAVAGVGGTARVDLAAGTVEVAGIDDVATVRRAIEAEGYTVVPDSGAPATSGCCGGPVR